MSADQIVFLCILLVAVVKIECAFQRMTWRTFPPRWLADLVILIAGSGCAREILVSDWRPGWLVVLLLAGATLLLVFERRWPAACKPKPDAAPHHPV
jgi:hypothetical protein